MYLELERLEKRDCPNAAFAAFALSIEPQLYAAGLAQAQYLQSGAVPILQADYEIALAQSGGAQTPAVVLAANNLQIGQSIVGIYQQMFPAVFAATYAAAYAAPYGPAVPAMPL